MRYLFFFILTLLPSCTRKPIRAASEAMRAAETPVLRDDLTLESLRAGLAQQMAFHRKLSPEQPLVFGPRQIRRGDYLAALESFDAFLAQGPSLDAVTREVASRFSFYEVYGGKKWGEILLTGYYAPRIPGSLTRRVPFTEALLERPLDLVEVVLSDYDDRFRGIDNMRGRLVRRPDGRQSLLPYYTREEIDKGALRNTAKVLVYVSPTDAFFLQIQGSGTIWLPDGREIEVGYADQNGHRYEAIGKFMRQFIPLEEITQPRIEAELQNLPTEEREKLLWKNPSFVFFQKREGRPITQNGTRTVDGRTLATDLSLFPKGTLAFLTYHRPIHTSTDQPAKTEEAARFVFDQDTGGAIKGPGRADLFIGQGEGAKFEAGVLKAKARLYYLVPKLPDSGS